MSKLPAFEIIGSREGAVAIMEKARNAKGAAKEIMARHKNVKSVLMKAGPRKGKYRKRAYRIIAGSKNTEVVHAESGCRFLLDVRKAYFSPRESTERMRIAEKVKPGEKVAVFFAGVGPFAIVIAKKAKPAKVTGIELNPSAVKYFRKNATLNKVEDMVEIERGDVKKLATKYRGEFDRIIMPLPEKAKEFLNSAEKCAKKNALIHYYCFCREDEIKAEKAKIRNSIKRRINFLQVQKVLPWGPRIFKYRIDFRVY
ncbi:MAG: methyltransferase [Candidatus Aenigmarchaeota archaeon]|nr:methyltransferase [Candidatus Aenigmarchaeota archaeon]